MSERFDGTRRDRDGRGLRHRPGHGAGVRARGRGEWRRPTCRWPRPTRWPPRRWPRADAPSRSPCDVSQAPRTASARSRDAEAALGPLDVLVNNAGIGASGTVLTTDEATWDRLMAVNVKGTYLMSRAALAVMVPRRRGVIVNAGSIAGVRAVADRAAYVDHQVRGRRPHEGDGPRPREGRHPRERGLPRHDDDAVDRASGSKEAPDPRGGDGRPRRPPADGPPRHARRRWPPPTSSSPRTSRPSPPARR